MERVKDFVVWHEPLHDGNVDINLSFSYKITAKGMGSTTEPINISMNPSLAKVLVVLLQQQLEEVKETYNITINMPEIKEKENKQTSTSYVG